MLNIAMQLYIVFQSNFAGTSVWSFREVIHWSHIRSTICDILYLYICIHVDGERINNAVVD
jgi:hypothetical protein